MGWLMTQGQTREELIAHLTREQTGENGTTWTTLRHSARGNVLWAVIERREPSGKVERFIGCFLMASERGYGWGYKDMDCCMGPAEVSCPLSYLKLVPAHDGSYCEAWRKRVRDAAAAKREQGRKAAALAPGQTIRLREGYRPPELTVVSVRPLRAEAGGRIYKIPTKAIQW